MKKFLFPILLVSFLIAFYEQKSEKPNLVITVLAIVIFMFAMMKLSSKIKSNSKEKEDE